MSAKMTALCARLRRATLNRRSACRKKPRRLYRPVSTSVSDSRRISDVASSRCASSAACVMVVVAICADWFDTRRSSELRDSILPRAAAASSRTMDIVRL